MNGGKITHMQTQQTLTPYKVDFKLKGINVVKPVLIVLLNHHTKMPHFKFPQNHNYGIETII